MIMYIEERLRVSDTQGTFPFLLVLFTASCFVSGFVWGKSTGGTFPLSDFEKRD